MHFVHVQQNVCLQQESSIDMIIQKISLTENKMFNRSLSILIFMPKTPKQGVKTFFFHFSKYILNISFFDVKKCICDFIFHLMLHFNTI